MHQPNAIGKVYSENCKQSNICGDLHRSKIVEIKWPWRDGAIDTNADFSIAGQAGQSVGFQGGSDTHGNPSSIFDVIEGRWT